MTNLYWRPVPDHHAGEIPERLAGILGENYGFPCELTDAKLDYLIGLRDAGVPGADDLVEAVHRCGRIHLWVAE